MTGFTEGGTVGIVKKDQVGQRADTRLEPSPNLFCGIIRRRTARERKNLHVGISFCELLDGTRDMYGCMIRNRDCFCVLAMSGQLMRKGFEGLTVTFSRTLKVLLPGLPSEGACRNHRNLSVISQERISQPFFRYLFPAALSAEDLNCT